MTTPDFDFTTNAYYVELRIRRDTTAVLVNVGVIQIWEAAGVACP
jgi:hypothetical protein